jgi:hypothetical protein
MLARDAHGGALVALNHVPSNAKHSREVIFTKAKARRFPLRRRPTCRSIGVIVVLPRAVSFILIDNKREQSWWRVSVATEH